MQVALLAGGICAAFGPAYAHTALRLLYGEARASAPGAAGALAAYSAYVLVMALNGITEAFVHAVAGTRQLMQVRRERSAQARTGARSCDARRARGWRPGDCDALPARSRRAPWR